MAGEFFRQYGAISMDWMVGAFVGATLDYVFSMITTKSHILNLISAVMQFTCGTFICHEFLYGMGQRRGNNTIQNTWILWFALWSMSPNAQEKLQKTYYSFHKLLYGTRSLVPDAEPTKEEESTAEKKTTGCQCS